MVKYKEDLYWEGDDVSTRRLNNGIQGYIKSRLTVIHECLVFYRLDGVWDRIIVVDEYPTILSLVHSALASRVRMDTWLDVVIVEWFKV